MPHTPEAKAKTIARVRRIKGQAEALERAIEAGTECAPLLQQIVALRGAANGLMSEVMESYLQESFASQSPATHGCDPDEQDAKISEILKIVRRYFK
ncbi:metal/formaldehyde-sensitive transcriptional repressor [Kozakia baliensis]|uniref:Regulator n=1 Tax=Kozakia baliensis TaxID=153496 RepID=A0A1D8UXZ9_9PROT|nr:metal/formaldehyde-sensitive transcriptional repressor [Kozakia baliensis]AOX18510.1 regulator [Kozakia baliensis]GBR26927.1 regulator protein FrmR [Kozakia baliensis NRIC 0488]GEL65719.1 hypothetical protein KBA01_30050 [Kozakia baliensis]